MHELTAGGSSPVEYGGKDGRTDERHASTAQQQKVRRGVIYSTLAVICQAFGHFLVCIIDRLRNYYHFLTFSHRSRPDRQSRRGNAAHNPNSEIVEYSIIQTFISDNRKINLQLSALFIYIYTTVLLYIILYTIM